MSAPPVIADLVERFEQQGDAYKSGQYNEAQLRQEFVDPMFKALGWDMENISGYAEAYKDVIHEDAIRIGGAIKELDDIILTRDLPEQGLRAVRYWHGRAGSSEQRRLRGGVHFFGWRDHRRDYVDG